MIDAYVDTSALVKLVRVEPETSALRAYLAKRPRRTASALVRAELLRAVRRGSGSLATARQILRSVSLVDVDREVLDRAALLDPVELRPLDAIHVATALLVGDVDVVTYDDHLAAAASASGLTVVMPGRREA